MYFSQMRYISINLHRPTIHILYIRSLSSHSTTRQSFKIFNSFQMAQKISFFFPFGNFIFKSICGVWWRVRWWKEATKKGIKKKFQSFFDWHVMWDLNQDTIEFNAAIAFLHNFGSRKKVWLYRNINSI